MNTTLEHKSQAPNQRTQQHENQSGKAYPSRTIVHAKLEMTKPGDCDEQEADAMADAVVSGGKISRKISSGAGGGSGIAVSTQMESQLSHLQGNGRQMPQGLRNMMENGFRHDFSQVRLHTDAEAADMSSSIHARAFTLGNDIYFNRGQFSPDTTAGQHLVAHELTHVVQKSGKMGRVTDKDPFVDTSHPEYSRKDHTIVLAKKMIEKSINVLERMSQDGTYIDLFYYCFHGSGSFRDNIGRINHVIDNYRKMYKELSETHSIRFDLVTHLSYMGVDVDGLTYNLNDIDENNPQEAENVIQLESSIYNSISDGWADQLKLASVIIHELSHRICGTQDITYFSDYRNRQWRINEVSPSEDLVNNATSYENFSSWVETTIFSIYDSEFTVNNNGKWERNKYSVCDNGNPSLCSL